MNVGDYLDRLVHHSGNEKSLSPDERPFLWGAAIASHQVEGGNHNQWSEWELKNAQRLAKEAEKRIGWMQNWESIKAEATDPANYISGRAVEHYKRYKEDIAIAKKLNLNALRFSIEWSRLEPEEGKWNVGEFRYYHNYIKELRRNGIEPVVTLWHWTVPVWFEKKGGWTKYKNVKYFTRYCKKVMELIGHDVRYITILNEPNVYATFGYFTREFPPAIRSTWKMINVYWNLATAYKQTAAALKNIDHSFQVSVAMHCSWDVPADKRVSSRISAKLAGYAWNWWWLNRVRSKLDFVGVNHYFTNHYQGFKRVNNNQPVNDMGWWMVPSNIGPLVENVHQRYKKPIMITENGLADASDSQRKWWIEETLSALDKAGKRTEIIGYMHWSLLDNFEWTSGFWARFGLIAVDQDTMKRTVRPSAKWYAQQIAKKRK